jgi:hypothetical protein
MFNFRENFQKIKTNKTMVAFLKNNKTFFITILVLIFFSDFTKQFLILIDTFLKFILENNIEILRLYNIFSWIVIFLIFLLILNFIICSKKDKKINSKKLYFKSSEISIAQRIFVLLPFLWQLVEQFVWQSNAAYNVFEPFVNQDNFEYYLLIPLTSAYSSIPFHTSGFSYFLFFLRFYYIGRNKEQFNYYTRYFYVQSFLISTLYGFFIGLLAPIQQYSPFGEEFIELYEYLIFYIFLLLTIYSMIYIILGKETKIPFIDEAVQYHIGIRKAKK